MPSCIVLGSNSDIAKELTPRLMTDGWTVLPWARDQTLPVAEWDAIICAMGTLEPIGRFFDTNETQWRSGLWSNACFPLGLLRGLWPQRRPMASVCFFSGAGVSRPARTYSAYAASKALLMKMTELLDDEYDEKFFIIGPGMVRTKIQQQTLRAGADADNYERVKAFMADGDAAHGAGTSHDRIYACLKWCLDAPKDVVGGRNFYAPGMDWGPQVEPLLRANRDLFKLRRFGGGL